LKAKNKEKMIPFFVVDRPISLEIIKSYWSRRPDIKYGLMTHALTSENFRSLFSRYPCSASGFCQACLAESNESEGKCEKGSNLRKNIVKMCDSGIFAVDRSLSYEELFKRYDEMDIDYGVMIDYFTDSSKTLDSAKEAVAAYSRRKYNFKLVLVAQGKTIKEYLGCYQTLVELGEYPIAIGGLLRRKLKSSRYIHLGEEQLLGSLLSEIREKFDPDWLFVLGVYHPKRHDLMSKYNVYGADYKGWIFNYKHKRDQLAELLASFRDTRKADLNSRLDQLLARRYALERQLKRKTTELRGDIEQSDKQRAKKRRDTVLDLIDFTDEEILKLTGTRFRNDGLSKDELELLKDMGSLGAMSEQQVRFKSVHNYFEEKVLPKIIDDLAILQ
jgi:hypothetical protein